MENGGVQYLVRRAGNIRNPTEAIDLPGILCLSRFDNLLEGMTNVVDVDLGIPSVPAW